MDEKIRNKNEILTIKAKAFDMILDYLYVNRHTNGLTVSLEKELEYVLGIVQAIDMAIRTVDPPKFDF